MKLKICLGAFIFIILFCLTGCGKNKLVNYESELLNFNFEDYVVSSKGNIENDYANVVFELNKDKVVNFKTNFKNKVSELGKDGLSMYEGSNIYNDITSFCSLNNIDSVYYSLSTGDGTKTRDIYIVLCSKDNKYYLNIIG